MNHITTENYYLKNFISKLLGMIAAREYPICYDAFFKILLQNLLNVSNTGSSANEETNNSIDTYLRIIYDVLNEADDRFAQFSDEILPIILTVFKNSKVNFIFDFM